MRRGRMAAFAILLLSLGIVGVAFVGCGTAQRVSPTASVLAESTSEATQPDDTQPVGSTADAMAPPPEVSFVVPVGTGEGEVAYVKDQEEEWGPESFCVLPDKSVAIVDLGNHEIKVFDDAGSFLHSVDLGDGSRPVDLRWWNDSFAVLDVNSQPQSLVLIDRQGGVRGRIDLGMDLVDVSLPGGLRVGPNGELELLAGAGGIHMLTDAQGNSLPFEAMAEIHSTIAFQGGPDFEISTGQGSPQVKLVGSSKWISCFTPASGGVVGATPLGSDDSGSTYFEVHVQHVLPDQTLAFEFIVVKLDATLRQVGLARVDRAGSVIIPDRWLDVTPDGNVYSMVPKDDGVHISTLVFSATLPAFQP